MSGQVVSIHIGSDAGASLTEVAEAELVAGRGIVGDRYYAETGTFSPDAPDADHELTLVAVEEISAFNAATGRSLSSGELRRNIVTRGVDLNAFVGREFLVGSVRVRGIRLCEPCSYLAGLVGSEVLPALVHRAGLRAGIVEGGTIRVGDQLEVASLEEVQS